jgi:hypothetical protein
MSYLKSGIAVGLAGALALGTVAPSVAAMPTAVAAVKTAPSDDTINVRWGWRHGGWWGPGIGLGIGLGLLGAAAIASSPYYYGGYGCPYGYYGSYGCGYGYAGYYGGYGYPAYAYGGYYARPYYGWGWRHRHYWRHW